MIIYLHKEEVLQNKYYRLSIDNWNQTLRKSKAFFQSFARKQIRSSQNGKYIDFITGNITRWKANVQIKRREILTVI